MQDALNGGGTTHWANNLGMMRNQNQNRGAFLGVSNPAYHGEVTPLYKGMWVHDGHRIGSAPSAELYMHRLMQLAERVESYAALWGGCPLGVGDCISQLVLWKSPSAFISQSWGCVVMPPARRQLRLFRSHRA